MYRKILALLICAICIHNTAISQSLEMLQQLSTQEMEQLMQLQKSPNMNLPIQSVGRIGDKTSKVRSYMTIDTTTRRTLGEAQQMSRWDEIYKKNGDSTTLSTIQYIEFLKKGEVDSSNLVFGHNIFRRNNLTFAPSLSIPTPVDYVISSGDVLIVSVWGSSENEYELTVSPEGNIYLPSAGVIKVGGMTIGSAESRIRSRLASSGGSAKVKVTLGDIRSITVNIVGEAHQPGTYTLPSLSSVFNAIYAAGGVSDIGSVRDIKLYREGKLITTIDVYDYLLNGSNEGDKRLEDNDLIVVSPYTSVVNVTGNVRRPMRYEVLAGENVKQLLEYAGGLAGDAYDENLGVYRRSGGREYSIHTVEKAKFEEFILTDKDSVVIGAIVPRFANLVNIEGAVWRPGNYELGERINTVKDLVMIAEGLRDDAFAGRAQIVRTQLDKSLEVIPININAILMGRDEDIALQNEDRVIVTSIDELREGQNISITGEVNDPHTMPYAKGMTIGDAIILAKGLKNSASLARIEVARRVNNNTVEVAGTQRAEYFSFPISEDLSINDVMANFELMPYDQIFIRKSPGYKQQQIVIVEGEVNFEGEYAMVTVADKLTDLVQAAGGITEQAYLEGASLYRKYSQRDLEKKKTIENLLDVVNKKPVDSVDVSEVEIGEYYTVGIDLATAIAKPKSSANITLMEGDKLFVPTMDNTVTIIGAVYYPNTTTFNQKYTVRQYIQQAGGYSTQAKRRPFVVHMNGKVRAASTPGVRPEPGCTIVVPFKEYKEPMSPQGWVGISSSIVSMAAMVVSLIQ